MSPLTDSAQSGGGAYSGRMTEQSLTVQRSLLLSGLLYAYVFLARTDRRPLGCHDNVAARHCFAFHKH